MNRRAVSTLSRVGSLLKGRTRLDQSTELLGFYSFCPVAPFLFFFFPTGESLGVLP